MCGLYARVVACRDGRQRLTFGRAFMITETTPAAPAVKPLVDFFSAAEARTDRWRQICAAVRAWQAASARNADDDTGLNEAMGLFGDVAGLEAYFAYPGPRLLAAIEQSL